MEEQLVSKKRRKPRSDRNHVIYLLNCKVTGERYIGMTVCRGQAIKGSMDARWKGHVHHATVELRETLLAQAIRLHGDRAFDKEVLEIIRGKAAAHKRETVLIGERKPELNMESMGRKRNSVHN